MKLKRSLICIFATILLGSINCIKMTNTSSSHFKSMIKAKSTATLTNKATALSSMMSNMRESVMSKAEMMSKELSRKNEEANQLMLKFNSEKSSAEAMIQNSKSEIEKLFKIKESLQNTNSEIKVASTKLIDTINNQETQQIDSFLNKEKENQRKLSSTLETVRKEKSDLAKIIESSATQLQNEIIGNNISHNEENLKLKSMDKLTLDLNTSVEKEKELLLKTADKQKQIEEIEREHGLKHKEYYARISKDLVNYEKMIGLELDVFKRYNEFRTNSDPTKFEFIESSQQVISQLKEQLSELKNSGSCDLSPSFKETIKSFFKSNHKFRELFKNEIEEYITEKQIRLNKLQEDVENNSKKIESLKRDQNTYNSKIKLVEMAKNQEIQNLELMSIHTEINEITKNEKNLEAIKELYSKNVGLQGNDITIEDINLKQRKGHQFAEAIKETIKSVQEKYIADLNASAKEKEDILNQKKSELETKMNELSSLAKKIKLRDKNLEQLQEKNSQVKQESEMLEKKKNELISEIKIKQESIRSLEKSNEELKENLKAKLKELKEMTISMTLEKNQDEKKIAKVSSTLDNQASLVDQLSEALKNKVDKLNSEIEKSKTQESTIESLNRKITELGSQIKTEQEKVVALTKINETLKTVRTSEEKFSPLLDSKKQSKKHSIVK